jgi:hypothetical protein
VPAAELFGDEFTVQRGSAVLRLMPIPVSQPDSTIEYTYSIVNGGGLTASCSFRLQRTTPEFLTTS